MEETKTTPPEYKSRLPIEGQNTQEQTNTVRFDLEAYMPLLEDADISDAQKMELLRSLYAIMASFVDLGFSLKAPACGQATKDTDTSANALRDHVYSSHHNFNERIENAARSDKDVAGEGVKT